eukprot:1159135-Pelagomonas_calceolata.AAC.4
MPARRRARARARLRFERFLRRKHVHGKDGHSCEQYYVSSRVSVCPRLEVRKSKTRYMLSSVAIALRRVSHTGKIGSFH